jgi:hypothetical protein
MKGAAGSCGLNVAICAPADETVVDSARAEGLSLTKSHQKTCTLPEHARRLCGEADHSLRQPFHSPKNGTISQQRDKHEQQRYVPWRARMTSE